MHPAPGKAPRGGPHEAYLAIERFLKASKKPVLIEPGEEPLPISGDTFALSSRGSAVTIECWSDLRNVVRRVSSLKLERPGRLELEVERFGGRLGSLTLVDLDRPSNHEATRKGARLMYAERFRESLHRQFPEWRLVELSTSPDLHHSLSPTYPRAFLRRGTSALAAIGAAEDALLPDGALSFGLIWLDYLRRREKRLNVEGLAIFVPAGREHTTCHRVRYLDPQVARYTVFTCDAEGEERVDPWEYTNLDTRLGATPKTTKRTQGSTLERTGPEAWLEARLRGQIQALDASLQAQPVYSQVLEFAGGQRGILDLLAVDVDRRLVIIELKVEPEIHLPLQALDYWMRVKWHLDRGEFAGRGYLSGIELSAEVPRVLLVAPALEYHPSNETILRYFSAGIPVVRLGIGLEWRRELKVMFRAPISRWPLPFSAK